jgi:hypothetical protein
MAETPLVRSERGLLLYPEAQIEDRRVTTGKVFARNPLSNVRRDIRGELTVTELTQSAVEADLDIEVLSTIRKLNQTEPASINDEKYETT